MCRPDRLFALVQLIRGRRLSTAAWLAGRLEVSARTVYRDVADPQVQGVPIEGEAGVGCRLGRGFELPPLMFTADEALVLVAGDAMSHVFSVLPAAVRSEVERMPMLVPPMGLAPEAGVLLQQLREATQGRTVLQIGYCDASEQPSTRRVWPLGCFFGARCERWRPGAKSGRTFAASAWTASARWRCWICAFPTRPARPWPICCARKRTAPCRPPSRLRPARPRCPWPTSRVRPAARSA